MDSDAALRCSGAAEVKLEIGWFLIIQERLSHAHHGAGCSPSEMGRLGEAYVGGVFSSHSTY